MEASTTIKQMLAGNKIFVPSYQRAYSWETEQEKLKSPKQVNVFLSDLEEYNRSASKSPYYFGHFLFEEKDSGTFAVIDGQQRLTTIVIFLSTLFFQLKKIRPLNEIEEKIYEDIIKCKSTYRFETVEYDKQLFKDYVIDMVKKDKKNLETESAKRIVGTFDFFISYFDDKDEKYLLKMLDTIQNASCTTHQVENEAEAIQMFLFQNNRGKKPSNLEIIKAQFMFNVHLHGGDEKEALTEEIKNRFETIYKSISLIEYRIDEDDVLVYTLRVYFNSLWETDAIDRINGKLSEENPIPFIKAFTQSLATSFEHLTTFFGKDEQENIEVHSLVTLGGIGIAIPFIIKAYKFGLTMDQINLLCSKLETIVLRHRLIGTRANIISRLDDVYKTFTYDNPDMKPIEERIDLLKETEDWWWAYWNDEALNNSIHGWIHPTTAKYILWKYENYLESQGKKGYKPTRFDTIGNPEIEHIAPQTENPESGYDEYNEEFINEYIDCLGNYLLISKSHNASIGNRPFEEKRASYNRLYQQREVQEMTKDKAVWDKTKINERHEKIVNFILEHLC